MSSPLQPEVTLVAEFIDTRGSGFHSAFEVPSDLNRSTMTYEPQAVSDLSETLGRHQQIAGKYVDFTSSLSTCTWDHVHEELRKAQVAALESERRGKNLIKKGWRTIGATSSILAPGLAALPDNLSVLNGGLAVIFSLARHSEMNRQKLLTAFENVPNVIEMAQNKAKTFPLNGDNPKSVQLHKGVQELQATLLRNLPLLINKLIPGTFLNAWKSPFGTWKIDRLLDEVSACAERVRVCATSLVEELIVDNYSASMNIQSQLVEVLRYQREMQMSIDAAHSKTNVLHFLMEQLNFTVPGAITGRDPADMSDIGTALPGYTAEDLLKIIDVNHLRISHDATNIVRRSTSFDPADVERAASMIMTPQVKDLLQNSGSSIVAIDGHFDRTQMGKISPLSYVCALLAQALRQQSYQYTTTFGAASSIPSQSEKGPSQRIVLEYYCAIHMADDDDLRGPQGLMRCLTTQLLLSLVANEWIRHTEAVNLPHLRDGEEELLAQLSLDAVCRLFTALVGLVPRGVPIYCLADGWSAYEREGLWQADYRVVFNAFRDAADVSNPDDGTSFKLLLTSPTANRWLDDLLMPGQKVSLRNREPNGANWRIASRGGIMNVARAATMPDVHGAFAREQAVDGGGGQGWTRDAYDRRSLN